MTYHDPICQCDACLGKDQPPKPGEQITIRIRVDKTIPEGHKALSDIQSIVTGMRDGRHFTGRANVLLAALLNHSLHFDHDAAGEKPPDD